MIVIVIKVVTIVHCLTLTVVQTLKMKINNLKVRPCDAPNIINCPCVGLK